jgi:hypothetical protein
MTAVSAKQCDPKEPNDPACADFNVPIDGDD